MHTIVTYKSSCVSVQQRSLVDTAPELCQKGDIFLEKRMEGIFVYVLEYMLTLVSLDKK